MASKLDHTFSICVHKQEKKNATRKNGDRGAGRGMNEQGGGGAGPQRVSIQILNCLVRT